MTETRLSERQLLKIALLKLDQILRILAPPKAHDLGGSASTLSPKGSPFPRRPPVAQVTKLDYKSDLEDALLTLSPDGPLDGPPTWSAQDQDGAAVPVEVDTNSLRAIVRLPTDAAVFDFTVTATAAVDDPRTPEIETISSTFHIAGSHSKALDLGGTAGTITKGGSF